jgi:hypothetical protein
VKKHLFGAAVFVSIVAFSALIGRFFARPAIPATPAVDHPNQIQPSNFAGVSARVITAEYNEQTGTLVAKIEFEWKGGSPPDTVKYRVFLTDSRLSKQSAVVLDTIDRPLVGTSRIVRPVTFLNSQTARFRSLDNVYMHVDTGRDVRKSDLTYVPVLKIH